jgi:hypothetical protein
MQLYPVVLNGKQEHTNRAKIRKSYFLECGILVLASPLATPFMLGQLNTCIGSMLDNVCQ